MENLQKLRINPIKPYLQLFFFYHSPLYNSMCKNLVKINVHTILQPTQVGFSHPMHVCLYLASHLILLHFSFLFSVQHQMLPSFVVIILSSGLGQYCGFLVFPCCSYLRLSYNPSTFVKLLVATTLLLLLLACKSFKQ